MRKDYAARAEALVGTPFRPQGRCPEHGLDCVGLVMLVFGIPEKAVRRNYSLRGDYLREIVATSRTFFRPVSCAARRPGDVMLLRIASDQLHLAVQTAQGFVHADARLRRVVQTPGAPRWATEGLFRRRTRIALES
jgi:hypothetical protein